MFESLIILTFYVTLCCGALNPSQNNSLILHNKKEVARAGGWGWGDHGVTTFLDKIASLLTFLSFGMFLLNLLLNALLLGGGLGLFPTTTGGTTTGGTTTGGTTTGGTTTGGTTTGGTTTGGTTTGGTTTGGTTTGGTITGGVTVTAPTGIGRGFTMEITGNGTLARARVKRSPLELRIEPSIGANAMAEEMMRLIDSILNEEECVPKFICEGNRKASVIGNGFQYLMPLCSLGTSYFGERFGFHQNLTSYLDAIYNGVSEVNCGSRYPWCQR